MTKKFLLVPAEGDDDEDEGMTKRELLEMLARELGVALPQPGDTIVSRRKKGS